MNRFSGFVAVAALLLLPGLALAQNGQSRLTGLKLSGDEPIEIESDRFEVSENESVGVFSGNVSVMQGTTLMKAGRMKVFYDREGGSAATGNAQIDRLEVDGGVYVKSNKQVATGDRATFDMASEVLVLSGKEVVLTEGENVIVGCKLTVRMATGQGTLESCQGEESDGRVRMLLTPNSGNEQ